MSNQPREINDALSASFWWCFVSSARSGRRYHRGRVFFLSEHACFGLPPVTQRHPHREFLCHATNNYVGCVCVGGCSLPSEAAWIVTALVSFLGLSRRHGNCCWKHSGVTVVIVHMLRAERARLRACADYSSSVRGCELQAVALTEDCRARNQMNEASGLKG